MKKLVSPKTLAFAFFLALLATSPLRSDAQILFDNGPYFNRTGTGFGGANESVLYTTTFGMGTIGFGHQSNLFNRVADDFVVDACHWRVDSIVFFGYQTGSTTTSTFTGVNFRIWDSIPDAVGSNVVFGDTTTNRMTRTAFSGAYRITETTTGNSTRPMMRNVCALNNVVLSSGTFWIDWASTGSLGSGPWAPSRTPVNVAITGNGKQRIGTVWNNLVDGGTGTPAQGLPFIIYGTVLDPVADAGTDQSGCPGSSVTLGGSPSGSGGQGPLTYSWNNGSTLNDSLLANPTAMPGGNTTYILSVTDTSGCTVVDTTVVTIGATASNFLIADTTICANDVITLDAGTANSYLWSNGDTSQTITVGSGAYFVAVDNGSGCLSLDTVVVSAAQGVSIIGNGTFCQQAGDTLTASISGGVYTWSTGETTQSIIVNSTGPYSVTVVDGNGCTSVDTFSVVAIPAPTAAFTFSVGAAGLTYSFTDQSTGGATSYAWNFGDGGTATTASPSHTYAASGNYSVTLIASNACGSDTSTQSLTVTDVQSALPFANVSVYPNPTTSKFEFSVTGLNLGSLQVDMMDVNGKVCKTWSFESAAQGINQSVDASKFAKGVYFMRFSNAEGMEMRKLVIE
jgi:hypothetical protein